MRAKQGADPIRALGANGKQIAGSHAPVPSADAESFKNITPLMGRVYISLDLQIHK